MYPCLDDFFNEQFERVLSTFSFSQLHTLGSDHWLRVSGGSTAFDKQSWVYLQQGFFHQSSPLGRESGGSASPLPFLIGQ